MKITIINTFFIFLYLGFFLTGITGCSDNSQNQSNSNSTQITSSDSKLIIYVTNYPLKYFAETIGGNIIQVKLPVANNIDPAYWQPNSQIIQQMQLADVILINGATYEKWLNKVSLPHSVLKNQIY